MEASQIYEDADPWRMLSNTFDENSDFELQLPIGESLYVYTTEDWETARNGIEFECSFEVESEAVGLIEVIGMVDPHFTVDDENMVWTCGALITVTSDAEEGALLRGVLSAENDAF